MRKHITDTLADLIRFKSYLEEEKPDIIRYVVDILSPLNLKITEYGDDSSPAILAEYGEGGVVFAGHLDTCPIGEFWTYSQAQVVDGKMYGRGAADMKGSVTAMLNAAQELVKREIPFAIALTTDEETTMRGAESLCRAKTIRNAPAIVIGEPTNLNVGYAEKGLVFLQVETRGKAAHGAMPHLGENAILKMMKVLRTLETFKDTVQHPQLGGVTINIGTISGGEKVNVVADKCTAMIDVRFPPPHTVKSIYEALSKHMHTAKKDFVLNKTVELPAIEIDPNSEVIRATLEIAKTQLVGLKYTSELVKYYEVNRNVVLFGCGDEEVSHHVNEYVKLEDVLKASEVYKKIAARFAPK